MAIGAVTARIITQYSDKGSKAAARDINKLGKSFDKFAGKVAKSFGIAAAASAAFAVKIGTDAVKGAMADQKQQIALATALRNTTGATNEAIAATVKYLDAKELSIGVDNEELIPSLQTLVQATKDVTQAQILQNLALDISAGTGKNLEAVSLALAKALGGNVGALTRLGVPLDAVAVKSKDLNAILVSLGETFAGQADKRAQTFEFRMVRLQLAFNQVLDQLGYAFIPVLENFAQILMTKVIPAVQAFVNENGDKLVAALSQALKAVLGFGFTLFKIFSFVAKNKNVFITLGAIFAATFVAGKVIAFVTAIQGLVVAYKAIRAAALGAAAAQAVATGGISVAAGIAGAAAFAASLGGLYLITKKANSEMNKMETTGDDLAFSFDGLDGATDGFLNQLKGLNIDLNKAGKNTKALTAADLKLIQTQKALAALKKFNIKPTTETDPIQLEAARLNLIKQANIQESERVKAILANLEAQLKANDAIKRYTDLLGVVADSRISPEEVIVLSQKWGISKDAVIAYTSAIFAVNDGKISTKEVDALAAQWGVTKSQAQIYLDFFAALNDGKLSDEEINKLASKWGLTNKEVADYAKKISDGVTPSNLWPTPGNQAEKSWKDALTALNAYVAASGAKISAPAPSVPITGTPLPPGFKPEVVMPPQVTKPGQPGFIGPVVPSYDPLSSLRTTPAPSSSSQTQQGVLNKLKAMGIPMLADGGVVNSPTAALIGEAGPEAVIPLSRMGSMGSTVNIVVNGSVTSEGDLVNAIRNAILQGQNNGQAITKTAIQL
jgi:hypothetical protein